MLIISLFITSDLTENLPSSSRKHLFLFHCIIVNPPSVKTDVQTSRQWLRVCLACLSVCEPVCVYIHVCVWERDKLFVLYRGCCLSVYAPRFGICDYLPSPLRDAFTYANVFAEWDEEEQIKCMAWPERRRPALKRLQHVHQFSSHSFHLRYFFSSLNFPYFFFLLFLLSRCLINKLCPGTIILDTSTRQKNGKIWS